MGGPREGSDFQNLHRNKRSMTLNLKAPDGLAAFKRMVKKADVVVENFRPDVKKRLGIDYKTLAKINPRLVYASISGFGQDGPYADRPGFDQIAQGMGGLMSITGLPGQGPVRVGIPIADLSAGLFSALGILVALLERENSGKGQVIETSLLQAQIFMLDFQAARCLVQGEVARAGRQQSSDQHSDRRIQDATTATSTSPPPDIKSGCGFCQRARMRTHCLDKPDYRTAAARSEESRRAQCRASRPTSKTAAAPNGSSASTRPACPAGRSTAIDQVFADPQVQHLGIAQSVAGTKPALRLVGQPISMSRTPSRLVARPPELGEHTDAVLKEFGFSRPRQIAARGRLSAPRRDAVIEPNIEGQGGARLNDSNRQDARAQGSGRRHRDLQQSRPAQRRVARYVAGVHAHSRTIRRRRRCPRRRADRRRRQGVRIGRRHFEIRQRTRPRSKRPAPTTSPPTRPSTASTNSRSRPSR